VTYENVNMCGMCVSIQSLTFVLATIASLTFVLATIAAESEMS
jgi:hypothetical protein